MKMAAKRHLERVARSALVALVAACLVVSAGSTQAAVQFVSSGGTQNANGGWSLPNGGFCGPTAGATTRPECVATVFNTFTGSATCAPAAPAVGGTWVTAATATSFCI